MEGHRRNAIYGLLAFAIPSLVTLASFPVLIFYLGAETVGVYMLAMTLAVGWSVLDFGVSAATVKFVAEDVAKDDRKAAAEVIVASLVFYGTLGAIGSVAIWFLSPWLVKLFLVSDELQADSILAFRLAAFRFATFFLTTVFVSVFKGFYRFQYATLALSTLSIVTFGGATLGVLLADAGLVGISWIALAANLIVLALSGGMALAMCRKREILLASARPGIATARRIFSFGIFIGLNWIAYTLVSQIARMVLSAFAGPAAVAIFTIASTITLRAQGAFNAMFEFLLPMAAVVTQAFDRNAALKLRRVYGKSLGAGIALAVIGFGVLYAFAPTLMGWWLPQEIEAEVAVVLRILCIGAAVSSVAQATYHLINGLGRPAVNTVLLVVIPVITYAALFALSFRGMTVETFAIAQTLGFFFYGVAALAYSELVVWPRWIPRMVRLHEARGPESRRAPVDADIPGAT